jgi:hypothetical protein
MSRPRGGKVLKTRGPYLLKTDTLRAQTPPTHHSNCAAAGWRTASSSGSNRPRERTQLRVLTSQSRSRSRGRHSGPDGVRIRETSSTERSSTKRRCPRTCRSTPRSPPCRRSTASRPDRTGNRRSCNPLRFPPEGRADRSARWENRPSRRLAPEQRERLAPARDKRLPWPSALSRWEREKLVAQGLVSGVSRALPFGKR